MIHVDALKNTLNVSDYEVSIFPNDSCNVDTNVLVFHNGINWLVIPQIVMLKYPIVYFKYTSKTNNRIYVNTLFMCPITFRSSIFKDILTISKINGFDIQLKHMDSGDTFSVDNPFINDTKTYILRRTIKILKMREIFTTIIDPLYIVPNNNIQLPYIIDLSYISNKKDYNNKQISKIKYHPKTLVYIIRYLSTKSHKFNYTILIGCNANANQPSGYTNNAMFQKYIDVHNKHIENKKAYIFPMLLYVALTTYTNAKIIKLDC